MKLPYLTDRHDDMVQTRDIEGLCEELNTAREFISIFAECFQSKLSIDELLAEDMMVKYSVMMTISKFYLMGISAVLQEEDLDEAPKSKEKQNLH